MQELKFIKIGKVDIPHFEYEEYGVQGAGIKNTPIVNMDKYIDHSQDTELHYECLKGLAMNEHNFKMGMFFGALPPFEEKQRQGRSWTSIANDLDLNSQHGKIIKELIEKDGTYKSAYRYMYYGMNAVIPWFFGLYLKENSFVDKTGGGEWTKASEDFPLLKKYLESLPFKHIGRVLFFCTYPGTGVATHRDAHLADHKDHNINLFFEGGSRPSFVWDEITKEKIYLDSSAKSYFFNNRDYHGVDPEPNFRYTLRVDGTFTDELCNELGLENGYTWSEKFKKGIDT